MCSRRVSRSCTTSVTRAKSCAPEGLAGPAANSCTPEWLAGPAANSCTPEGLAGPAPLVSLALLLNLQTQRRVTTKKMLELHLRRTVHICCQSVEQS